MAVAGVQAVVAGADTLQPVVTVPKLASYILKSFCSLLEDDTSKKNGLSDTLNEASSVDALRKFISDPQVNAIMIERLSLKGLFAAAGDATGAAGSVYLSSFALRLWFSF